MPKTTLERQVYADLLDRYGRKVADAFMAAIDSIRQAVSLQRLTAAIEARDIEAALDELDIDPAAFDEMLDRIRDAYQDSGRTAADYMPRRRPDGLSLMIRFDGRNPEAERRLLEHSSALVTRTTSDMRAAARAALYDAMERGVNPRTAALDLVGRVSRVTGRREGGILGLSAAQEAYVARARAELGGGDLDAMRHYLTRARRDRRFDRSVQKAIREGRALTKKAIAKAVTAYERRLLALRGETIARVETMTAIQSARLEAYRQAAASGKFGAAAVRKVWRSAGDLRVRHTHRAINRESVGLEEAFVSPSGARLLHPMDASLGAGPDEIVNCRCDCEYRVDWLANLG